MPTIKDVARLAGVGLGTASRVISGKGSVSPTTEEKVRKAIEQLGFRPSHAARSLLTGSTKMIGVYIPMLKGTFYTPILQVIDAELRNAGLHMVVAFGVGDGDARRQAIEGIEFLIERGCDGLVVLSNALTDADVAVLWQKAKLVVVNHRYAIMPEQCLTADHVEGGRQAARALLDQKHRKIAVIAGPSYAPDAVERLQGFLDELAGEGIDTGKLWVRESDFSPEGGYAAARALVDSGYKFTALFCANDEMAVGALSCFQELGIAVPAQVSVLGYDDTPSAEFSAPRLTCVHIPWREMTRNGLNILLNLCYGLNRPVQREFPISVTWRGSVGRVARQRAAA
ncbi:MAG TPA: LacI family DNA-binding transcriptional regulator [Telluria sp.]|nr:LacI family DNA-binding transcriptional regulator [Telluria sp.]